MKTILVTGGAQGIGQAIVQKLLIDPDTAIIVIDKQQTKFIDDTLKNEATRVFFYKQDIAERNGLSQVLNQIKDKYQIDGIVNNAGEVYFEKWNELKLETWDRTLAVNVTAPLHIVHALSEKLTLNAAIVNIASVDGLCAAFDTIAYAASKAALINLTKSLAAVLSDKNIRVNAVAPGWVETEMTKDTMPPESIELTPLHRNAQPQEVANVVEFLLSDKASFINGQTIIIDGGLTIVDYTLFKESKK